MVLTTWFGDISFITQHTPFVRSSVTYNFLFWSKIFSLTLILVRLKYDVLVNFIEPTVNRHIKTHISLIHILNNISSFINVRVKILFCVIAWSLSQQKVFVNNLSTCTSQLVTLYITVLSSGKGNRIENEKIHKIQMDLTAQGKAPGLVEDIKEVSKEK